jgi:hypothetical protein
VVNDLEETMKTSRLLPFLLIFALTACNMPVSQTQAPFPVPNQTMTALFATALPTIAVTAKPGLPSPTPRPTILLPTLTPQVIFNTPTAEVIPTEVPPTATVEAPTPTDAPTAVVVDLSRRTVTSVTAARLTTKPVIDGDWNDLPDKETPAEILVYGTGWKGRDDLGASFRIGWDATNLYVAVKIRDDVYVQNATGENIFKGDSIEILMDTKVSDDYFYNKLSPDDYQLGITPGRPDVNGTKEAYLWLPTTIAGSRSQVSIASTRSSADGITRIEAAIPWSVFGVTPKAGMHLGFVLSVSDNDDPSKNVQQKMVSNVKTRVLTDPTTWGDLTLGN